MVDENDIPLSDQKEDQNHSLEKMYLLVSKLESQRNGHLSL
jgi:hypothetical protein